MESAFTQLPAFKVDPTMIRFIEQPCDFKAEVERGIKNSSCRIVMSSLYLGASETGLIDLLMRRLEQVPTLEVDILVDYFRGSRCDGEGASSVTLLAPLASKYGARAKISFYHTSTGIFEIMIVSPFLKKVIPSRFIEGIGLQHMKGFVFDDTFLITGANLSKDYFENRQDRYVVIQSRDLGDYFEDLIKTVSIFSHTFLDGHLIAPSKLLDGSDQDRKAFQLECKKTVLIFLSRWKAHTKISNGDTIVYPAIQMAPLSIQQDEETLSQLLTTTHNTQITIAAGYFNLPVKYQSYIWGSTNKFTILTSSPMANGFYNSKGVSRYLPFAYSYIITLFLKQAKRHGMLADINVQEYSKKGWTWHAKGLWITKGKQILTVIGSSNFNYRSLNRDLEAQVYIITQDPQLRRAIQANLKGLENHCTLVGLRDLEARKPHWLLKLATRTLAKMF